MAGLVVFWLSPLFHLWSRRHEYEANACAAGLVKRHQPLIAALRKLNEKSLSTLHPIASTIWNAKQPRVSSYPAGFYERR
ncbi:MAG: M48 family metalloprotease [Verrucomicrobiota bacterium]|jgi:Zn-dependent protease with chaperone function